MKKTKSKRGIEFKRTGLGRLTDLCREDVLRSYGPRYHAAAREMRHHASRKEIDRIARLRNPGFYKKSTPQVIYAKPIYDEAMIALIKSIPRKNHPDNLNGKCATNQPNVPGVADEGHAHVRLSSLGTRPQAVGAYPA